MMLGKLVPKFVIHHHRNWIKLYGIVYRNGIIAICTIDLAEHKQERTQVKSSRIDGSMGS